MDQPQHQVFGNAQSYRYMSYPFPKQELQLLYPGRLMNNQYHYTGENIPNENPEGLERTKYVGAALAKAAKMEGEALARHLGGKDKVVPHPAVEPEAIIEDPNLAGLSIHDLGGLNPNLDNVPSPYDNLKKIDKDDDRIVDRIRKEEGKGPTTEHNPDNILPEYDWKSLPEREYYETTVLESDSLSEKHRSTIMWISLIVIGIIAAVAIALMVYGAHKHKTDTNATKPSQYHYVAPQFLPPGTSPQNI